MSRLVLLSGWGVDKRIWQPLEDYWPAFVTYQAVDWPGYGGTPELAEHATLNHLADAMEASLPQDAVWVGWSLGGLLAGALLGRLPAPQRLVLLGVGEHFCSEGGVSEEELAAFQRAFHRRPVATWQHFLRWQTLGEPQGHHAHRQLQALLGDRPSAHNHTLSQGLLWLAHIDNSQRFRCAPCPIVQMAGEHDPLMAPQRRNHTIPITNAGHCPMLSQPAQLAQMLAEYAVLEEATLL